MKTIIYAILFAPSMLLAAIPWGYKVMFSENYQTNKEEWHKELFGNFFTRPYITIALHLFCDGDKSRLGW